MSPPGIRVVVVDDDFRVAQIHAEYVGRVDGFEVTSVAHTASAADEAVSAGRPDLLLLDLHLPDEHGLALLGRLRDGPGPYPDVIAITAARDIASVRAAMQLGVVSYLVKPFRFDALRERLQAYAELWDRTNRLAAGTGQAAQADVDRLFGGLRVAETEPLPKGHSRPTMELIRAAFADQGLEDLSAAEVAARVGVSRPTAQRYLTHLVRTGSLEIQLRYGSAGRPEHRYRTAGTTA